jgi:hypothetical protein
MTRAMKPMAMSTQRKMPPWVIISWRVRRLTSLLTPGAGGAGAGASGGGFFEGGGLRGLDRGYGGAEEEEECAAEGRSPHGWMYLRVWTRTRRRDEV